MKKRALLTTVALALGAVLFVSSCTQGEGAAVPEPEINTDALYVEVIEKNPGSVVNITEAVGFDWNTYFVKEETDNTGLVVIRVEKEDRTDYKLFDFTTKSYVEGAEVSFLSTDENYGGMQCLSNGLFYSYKTDKDGKTIYTLYSRDGKIKTGEGEIKGDVFFASDGTRLYPGVKKDVRIESDPFKKILTYGSGIELEDYYFYNRSLFNSEGEYIKPLDVDKHFKVPTGARLNASWIIGNRFFSQYAIKMPLESDDYDYYYENGASFMKMKLQTMYYDVAEDKTVVLDDFNWSISYTHSTFNSECVALSGAEIIDERLASQNLLQIFDSDGRISVDVQKLIPGANSLQLYGKNLIISDGLSDYIYRDGQLRGVFEKFDTNDYSQIYNGNVVFRSQNGVKEYIYSMSGELIDSRDIGTQIVGGSTLEGGIFNLVGDEMIFCDTENATVKRVKILNEGDRVTVGATMGMSTVIVSREPKDGFTVYFYSSEIEPLRNIYAAAPKCFGFADSTTYEVISIVDKDDNYLCYLITH